MVPHYTSPNNQTQAVQTRLSIPNNQPSSLRTNYPSNNQSNNPRPTRPPMEPISVSYTELLPWLIQSQLVARVPLTPIEPPYPRWYDANASYDYHYGIKGNSMEICQALKNAGYVNFSFDKASDPNVISNPLPNHSGPKINAILEGSTEGRRTCIRHVITPMKVIHEKLVQTGFLRTKKREITKENRLSKGYCKYHAEV